MHTCIREYLRARLPACMCVCLCEYATGTGQCLITANTGCRRCFFKLACCSLYPLADLLVVVVVVIIDVGIVVVVACFFLSLPQRLSPHIVVAWQTGFVCGMCTSVCCCRRSRRRRLVLLQQPLAVIRAKQASPGLSGQMGTAFKFRKAAAACPFPDATYTHIHTRPHL